ncbi:MAG: DUF2807 domain-containing protein [Chitinophagaceae bacterium]|jgi:hypothetical protein|nr:DUF2807 domain-containing protein [Chitinophagaceae bacterium]
MKKLIFVLAAMLTLASCGIIDMRGVRGNGNVVSRTYNDNNFTELYVGGAIQATIVQGNDFSIKLEAESNILDNISVRVSGGRLIIENKNGVGLSPTKPIRAYISAPQYKYLEASGASNISSTGKINGADEVRMNTSGASHINVDIDANKLSLDISGASGATLTGTAKQFSLDVSGASSFHGFGLLTEQTTVTAAGASGADINATQTLNADASGASTVSYKGKPQVSSNASGASAVKSAD